MTLCVNSLSTDNNSMSVAELRRVFFSFSSWTLVESRASCSLREFNKEDWWQIALISAALRRCIPLKLIAGAGRGMDDI